MTIIRISIFIIFISLLLTITSVAKAGVCIGQVQCTEQQDIDGGGYYCNDSNVITTESCNVGYTLNPDDCDTKAESDFTHCNSAHQTHCNTGGCTYNAGSGGGGGGGGGDTDPSCQEKSCPEGDDSCNCGRVHCCSPNRCCPTGCFDVCPSTYTGYHNGEGNYVNDPNPAIAGTTEYVAMNQCKAEGWIGDWNNKNDHFSYRIYDGDALITTGVADQPGWPALVDYCDGASCTYSKDIWGWVLSHDATKDHLIRVDANWDRHNLDWSPVQNTPRLLNCLVPSCRFVGALPGINYVDSDLSSHFTVNSNGVVLARTDILHLIKPQNTGWTNFKQCDAPNASPCVGSAQLGAGSYYLTCNAYGRKSDGGLAGCSGNPYCEWAPNPPADQNCGANGWIDCSLTTGIQDDYLDVESNYPPQATITGPTELSVGQTGLYTAHLTLNALNISKLPKIEIHRNSSPALNNNLLGQITGVNGNTSLDLTNVAFTPDAPGIYYIYVKGYNYNSSGSTLIRQCNPWPTAPDRDCVVGSGDYVMVNVTQTSDPWWQVKGSDVWIGGMLSNVMIPGSYPGDKYFNLDGSNGFPGISVYNDAVNSPDFGPVGSVSSKNWLANTSYRSDNQYSYDYFWNKIPANIVPEELTGFGQNNIDNPGFSDSRGYSWFRIKSGSSPTVINTPLNFGSTNNVIFVDDNLNINADISLDDGLGSVVFIVKGNISINSAVTSLEGLYFTPGTFSSGAGNNQLVVRGSVVALTSISFQRNLDVQNNIAPAEFVVFAPDQVILFPAVLGDRNIKYTEMPY